MFHISDGNIGASASSNAASDIAPGRCAFGWSWLCRRRRFSSAARSSRRARRCERKKSSPRGVAIGDVVKLLTGVGVGVAGVAGVAGVGV